MPQLPLLSLSGEQVGTVELNTAIFDAKVNEPLMHQLVVKLQAAQRSGTHKTKTRGMVSGGGVKPWRQKGTGRARQGSRVSPLWRGGGTVFGPQPHGYDQDMPKKMRRAALRSGLTSRVRDGAIVVLDEFTAPEPKTRHMAEALSGLDVGKRLLIVDETFEDNAYLATRNIAGVEMKPAASLNLIDVLGAGTIVLTVAGLHVLEERLSDGAS